MGTYQSKSSNSVKIITYGGILILILLTISNVLIKMNYSFITSLFLGIFVLAVFLYFYSNSLKEVVVEDKTLILQKNIGRIQIQLSKIESVKSVPQSAITMTAGSKGFYGFIGSTMDGSICLVKDRSQMIQIITSDKKYLISCDNSNELIKILCSQIEVD